MGVRLWRIVQQPTNSKRATGTFGIVYPTELLNIQRYRFSYSNISTLNSPHSTLFN
jgi:hypothetical protein